MVNAKYRSKDVIQIVYKINGYLVLFNGIYNEDSKTYDVTIGREFYYGIKFEINVEDSAKIVVGLESFRKTF